MRKTFITIIIMLIFAAANDCSALSIDLGRATKKDALPTITSTLIREKEVADPLPKVSDVESLSASKVTIDKKNVKARDVFNEIKKQTGNQMVISSSLNNPVLDSFSVNDKGYWETVDMLCQLSENHFSQDKDPGGG